jgi:tRNA (cytidine32/uridine32-2'-O)-methyltransferase
MQSLDSIRIVLVATSHPGNIGSAARAMKTMGLSRLALVAPLEFPSPEADALASGAGDILARADVVGSLAEALAPCRLVFGCTPRPRTVRMPELTPRDAAAQALAAASRGEEVAVVFGAERTGLSNDEIQACHVAVNIPANPDYDSLNLAQAVQVLCYELRLAAATLAGDVAHRDSNRDDPAAEPAATVAELEGLFAHLERALFAIDFFKGRSPRTIMRRLRRLFLRHALSRREVMILRGILADAERMARLAGRHSAAEPAPDQPDQRFGGETETERGQRDQ